MIRVNRIKNSKSSYEIGFFLNIDCKYQFIVIGVSFIKGLEFVIRWGIRQWLESLCVG